MRQRLALAEALIGDPHMLILDEPTNGLDPEGIRWFREWVVKAVATRDLGIVLSSHILTEVAHVAHRLLVLKNGRERFSGTVSELKGPSYTRVRTRDLEGAATLLRKQGFSLVQKNDDLHVDVTDPERTADIARTLAGANHDILALTPPSMDLEDRYLALMGSESSPSSCPGA